MSGCCYQKFNISHYGTTIPAYEGTSHFIFWGLGQTKTVDPNDVCGSRGVAGVETGYSFVDALFANLTWGIYQPREYKVFCNPEGAMRTHRSSSRPDSYNYHRYAY